MVTIELNFSNPNSREYKASETLKQLLSREFNPSERGKILIVPSVKCFGNAIQDIDIVVFGQLENVSREVFYKRNKIRLNIKTFCFCIEVKDHNPDPNDVSFSGCRAKVKYNGRWHDVTEQSDGQKYSLKNFLEDVTNWSPWICNFIWFRNIENGYLPSDYPNNYLGTDVNFQGLIEKALIQRQPFQSDYNNAYYLSCCRNSDDIFENLDQAFSLFEQQRQNLGKLTRERLEKITKKAILKNQKYAQAIGKKLVVIRGRAGTGKTIKLLHIAYDLCEKYNERCLILTYNKALVSDIRRLIALAGISTGIATRTIRVETIHKFMRSLLIGFGILSKGDMRFLEKYDSLKKELLSYIQEGLLDNSDVQKLMKERHEEVAWDKILIDEGQDWPADEKEILFTIFNSHNFIIADGVDQLIRSQIQANWIDTIDYHKPIISEKLSLRQKRNLCTFVQDFAEQHHIQWDIKPQRELLGGKIVIARDYNQELHKQLYSDCNNSGNKPYEMLFLIPPNLVTKSQNNGKETRNFASLNQWSQWGIKLWDGTSSDIRSDYPRDVDQHRIVQYDSCRGLEGWVVVCIWFDEFIKYKIDTYNSSENQQETLALFSEDEQRNEYAYKWSLIALTRAIDTIVITFKNPQSQYAKIFKTLAEKHQDFVEWLI